ncbi:hypothetical protein [Brevundimonas nasdae]|uniref:Tripartite tricarboxylate transporter TctB family protein n=1 Tax=Brevundimonas nasdae TaxID=172043 RepID=A0ABX8TJP4_9CAUL|nr:hypothetical protein [Brevundimonas nasdae]QYC11022.1 hypothetical protein KWG56_03150 [Brevundimonas nasdae]QYC13808.1 hypothetical protein KWG63_16700 [Brevundimonas nasdae]
MKTERRRRAAVIGGIALVMIAGAIFWRLAPVGAYPPVAIYALVIPVSAFVLGLILLLKSGFIDLLSITRAERKAATERQKAELSKVTGPSIALLIVLFLAGALMLAAPIADGRFGWGGTAIATSLYFVGLAALPLVSLLGTLLRFREINILAQRI